jgi:putative Ca2+/H+ antiporter (TMEM165/GDT1 family)
MSLTRFLGHLPHRILAAVVAAVFLLDAVLLLRGRHEESLAESHDKVGFWRVAATSFTMILVDEFGDLTQIVTANLAAKYHDPISVGIGSVIGLWAVGGRRSAVGGRRSAGWRSWVVRACCGSFRRNGSSESLP